MEITSLRRTGGAGQLVAMFDLRLTPDVKIFDWQLRLSSKGYRAFPPAPRHGRAVVSVSPGTFEEIGRMARTLYEEGISPNAVSH